MARPRKYYVIYEYGRAIGIADGLDAARRTHSGWNGFPSRLSAEEHAAWWNHKKDTEPQPVNETPARLLHG